MRKTTIILSFALGAFFISCNNNATSDKKVQTEAATHEQHEHEESSEAIELNNGEKWKVNEEMKPYVTKGSELVNTFIQNKGTDYKNLAEQLKSENDQLIKSCTMGGKSHEELHKWLHPHLELVDKLKKTNDAKEADEIVHQLEKSYQGYQNYFQ
ncbi:MAG: hypothetical protein JST23_10985 [Bacteroidetes bacterium]|nr:hypothetical protein [Bacteroidota bacterium]